MTASSGRGKSSMKKQESQLEGCAKAHRGGWRMDLMVKQCRRMLNERPLQHEVADAVLGLSSELANVGRRKLSGLTEPLLTFSLALCTCRRGTGGRERGSNPTRDPKINPHQAQHILKKRHTAGLSNFKKKVAGLMDAATAAGLVGCPAAELGLLMPAEGIAYDPPAGPDTDPSSSQQQASDSGLFDSDMAMVARMLRCGAASQQQEQQLEVCVDGAASGPFQPAADSITFEDVWTQFASADAQHPAQQQQQSGSAASYLGVAAAGAAQQQLQQLQLQAQEEQQDQEEQCDLTLLMQVEAGHVPGSPTLAALLQLDTPLCTPRAGAAWNQQQPNAGQLLAQPLAATGTGGLPAAGPAPSATSSHSLQAGAPMQAPLVPFGSGLPAGTASATGGLWQQGSSVWQQGSCTLDANMLAGTTAPAPPAPAAGFAHSGAGASGSTSTSTLAPLRMPTPFLQPQVQLQQAAEQDLRWDQSKQQQLLQLLSPAGSATAQGLQAVQAAPAPGPDAVDLATEAAVNALLRVASSPDSSPAGAQRARHLLSLLRPYASPGATASMQPSGPLGAPAQAQEPPADLSFLFGAPPAGPCSAAELKGKGNDWRGSSCYDPAAAYAARVAANARDNGSIVRVHMIGAAGVPQQQAVAANTPGAASLGAAHAPAQQQGMAAPVPAAAPAPAAAPVLAQFPAAQAPPAAQVPPAAQAPAAGLQVAPMVQALLQQIDGIVANNAPQNVGPALSGLFPLVSAAAAEGHDVRPVLNRLYLLMVQGAALQVRQLQGLMQQLQAAGQGSDLQAGMDLILQAAAFPGLAGYMSHALQGGNVAPAQPGNASAAAAAAAAGAPQAVAAAGAPQAVAPAVAPAANGAAAGQWFDDMVMQMMGGQ